MTDWAATGQMIAGIGTLAGSFAIIIAAYLGQRVVEDFRHQKVVERQIKQAELALSVAYKLKDAISEIRHPATLGHESETSRQELIGHDWFDRLDDRRKDRYVQSNVFYVRTRHHEDTFSKAFEILPFVRAYFGENLDSAFRSILRCGRSVRVYADAYARDEGRDPNFTRKIESIIWEGASLPEDDPTTREINESLECIESKLLPIIRVERNSGRIGVLGT